MRGALAAAALACALAGACARPIAPVTLPPLEAGVVAAAAQEWRDEGLPWSDRCDYVVPRVIVDRRTDLCLAPSWECVDAGRAIHIAPDIDVRGPHAYEGTIVHGMGHILGLCSTNRADPLPVDGVRTTQPFHRSIIWEQNPDGFVRRAQRRAIDGTR